jgi:hypothetical protein
MAIFRFSVQYSVRKCLFLVGTILFDTHNEDDPPENYCKKKKKELPYTQSNFYHVKKDASY